MKNIDLENIDSVLIIRLSSLGDILLSTPLIRTIKNKYPKISIDMMVKEQYIDVILHNPYLRNKFLFNSEKKEELIREIQSKEYNLIIDLQNNFYSKKISSGLKGIQVKFDKKSVRKFLLVQTKINLLKNAKQLPVRYAQILENFDLDDNGLDLFTTSNHSNLLNKDEKYIGICPGGRHFTKMWPKEYYINLCRKLIKDCCQVVLFGGKSDRKICAEIKSEVPEVINLQNNDDVLQTAADMKMCKAIYCNDSGLMHAACAANVPVIVFFGSTVEEFGFTPYKNKNVILENTSLFCRPCSHVGRKNCPKKHFKCMLDVTPQTAFDTLEKIFKV